VPTESRVVSGSLDEDRVVVVPLAHRVVIAVADGAGGTGSGGPAAQAVCDAVRQTAAALTDEAVDWVSLLRRIDAELAQNLGGQTTAVVLDIQGRTVTGASVGDSEALCASEAEVVDLTRHQHRKPLLGSGEAIVTPIGPVWYSGRIVVVTDGITKYVPYQKMIEIVRTAPLEEAIPSLVEAARLPNGELQDDVAAVLHDADTQS